MPLDAEEKLHYNKKKRREGTACLIVSKILPRHSKTA